MGLFSRLFKKNDVLDRRLAEEYAQAFLATGISAREARKMAREMVADAKREVDRRGWSHQRHEHGDMVLQQERLNPDLHRTLDKLRSDGVRDDDIRWVVELASARTRHG